MSRRPCLAKLSFLLLATTVSAPTISVAAIPYVETQTLRLMNPGKFDDFGFSLSAGGGSLIAGAIGLKDSQGFDVGAALVYRQNSEGKWTEQARLRPEDGQHNDAFGYASDIDGSVAIVGTLFHENATTSRGAAYLFADRGNGWSQLTELTSPDGDGDVFGLSVAISGKVAVVGDFASRDDPFPGPTVAIGAVYVYEENLLGQWQHSATFRGTSYGDSFGYHVGVDGDTIVATAPGTNNGDSNSEGAAYVYRNLGNQWVQTARLVASDPTTDVWLSGEVAIDHGRLIVVSAPKYGTDAHGGAYVFEEDANRTWRQTAQLIPHDIGDRWVIGHVSLSGDVAIVSAARAPYGAEPSSAYVFKRDPSGSWNEVAELGFENPRSSYLTDLAMGEGTIFISSEVNAPGVVHIYSQLPEPHPFAMSGGVIAGLLLARRHRRVLTAGSR